MRSLTAIIFLTLSSSVFAQSIPIVEPSDYEPLVQPSAYVYSFSFKRNPAFKRLQFCAGPLLIRGSGVIGDIPGAGFKWGGRVYSCDKGNPLSTPYDGKPYDFGLPYHLWLLLLFGVVIFFIKKEKIFSIFLYIFSSVAGVSFSSKKKI